MGLHWNPNDDVFVFKIENEPVKLSKRKLLSDAAKLFDPVGWLSSVTISMKMMFQQLWIQQFDWDDVLPYDISEKWLKIKQDSINLKQLKILRFICSRKSILELHGFCDASNLAYAAAVYIRSIDASGNYHAHFIASKYRVAPIKFLIIPKLELSAAHLLAKLMHIISNYLKIFL